jgi:tetratricopeptide (TPR) repeat protein
MLARALEEHTETTFVGEPPGAYWKHYGDGTSFELPSSGLTVWVSTIYHQLSSYAGDQRLLEIELPAPFASTDYFGGVDPALNEIRAAADRPLLANVFRERGGAAGVAVYEERLDAYGGVDWWAPFTLQALNSLGHELLEAGRYEDALAAYRLNTRRYPEHWRVWYSLARAQKRHGDREAAIVNYERALAADPFNNLAPNQREALKELRAPETPSP